MTDTSTTEPTSPPDGGGRSGRRNNSGGVAKSAAFSLGRGLILIAIAVIIGIVLLQVVDDGSTSKASTSSSTTATTAAKASTTATTAKADTNTTKPLTPTGQLSIVVLNATGQTGVAKSVSDKLGAAPLSYKTLTPGNSAKATGNIVYYTGDLSGEAAALATAVNASTQGVNGLSSDTKVEKLPDPKPKDWSADDVTKAQLVVVIGTK